MKLKITIIALFATLWAFAQTTVRFSETHQFFDASEKMLKVTILVDNIETYDSVKPIMVELFSDLEDPDPLGITKNHGIDRVILPENYSNGEEIQLLVNTEALKGIEKFKLSLRKKGENDRFKISQDSHAVIINENVTHTSYISIAALPINGIKTDIFNEESIEIPFRIETKGYIPVEADEAYAKVHIKGMEENNMINNFPLTGNISKHSVRVEKQQYPKEYEKLMELINSGELLELELSDVIHNPRHQVQINPEKKSTHFNLKKSGWVDASYSFHLGTNFEFSTNFEAKDIYYEVDISLLNLFKSRWGLRAGMYKNNTSRYLEDFMLRPTHYELVDETSDGNNDTSDSKIYNLVETGMVPGIAMESLGFYFNIPFKMIDSEYFKAYISPHFEIIERRETYTYEVLYENILTTEITAYELDFSIQRRLPNEVNSKYWEGYLGLSFPMLYRNPGEDFQVTINPIFGAGYPGPYAIFTPFYTGISDYDYVQIVEDNSGPLFFTAFQFNVIINPKESLGIKLGSDVRKYFGADRKPIISINLSTKLDFAQIFNLTGG